MDDSDVMLGAARVRDPSIAQLMATAQNAAVFQQCNNEWTRTYEGSFMLFNRNVKPQYGFIVLDRNRPDYLVELFADGASVTHEESASTGMSNTVKYISAHGQPVYMLAFESVTIAQSIFQKLKQAVLLVSVSRRANDRRASHPMKPSGQSPVLNGSGHGSQNGNGVQQISAENEQTVPLNGNADSRQNGLVFQLLAAKANYKATRTEKNGDTESPKGSSKKHRSSAHARSTAMTPNWENQVTPNRNASTGMYYAKPSAPTVSLNPLSSSNGASKIEVSATNVVIERALVEVQNGVETNDSPIKSVKTLPISLKQLFGQGNGITNIGLGSAVAHGETATSSPIGLVQPPKTPNGHGWSVTPVTDSSSNEAFNKLLSGAIALPTARLSNANGSTDTAHSGTTDTTSSISNGNYPSGDELSGSNDGPLHGERQVTRHYSRRAKDTDAVDSDSLLIAPDAFVTRCEKVTDSNRILLDMVMMHRAGDGDSTSLEQATDMRVEDRSRTSGSDTSGEPSSTTANDEVASRSHRSSPYSNSARSKSNSNTDSSESPRNDERPFERRTRNKHALQLTKEQLRATLIDLLENDDEFVKRLHQNYTQLLLRPRCDATHSTK